MSKYRGQRARDSIGKLSAHKIILAPMITEKSTRLNEVGQLTFKVDESANKFQIRKAIENLFGVQVTSVNTSIAKGKTKRFRGRFGKRNDTKRAIVQLKEGQSIDLSMGV